MLDVLNGLYGGGVYSVHLVSFVLCKVVIGVKYLDSLGDLCKARYVFRDSVKFSMCDAVEQMIVVFVRLVVVLSDRGGAYVRHSSSGVFRGVVLTHVG